MKRLIILFITFIISFTTTNIYSQSVKSDGYSTSIPRICTINNSTVLDSIITAQMTVNHIPGMATCIVKNDKIIWNSCYGYANIEKNLMVNDSTAFFLASVTKPFTGTALMQIWEKGLFGLDDNIYDWVPPGVSVVNPYHPDKAISFRMLFTHTSSIKYNYENSYFPLVTLGYETPVSLDSFVVNYFTPSGVYYDSTNYDTQAPGTKYEYSNEAIALAGYLAGVITDTSLACYCEDHIFKPLNMNHTAWFLSDLDTTNLAICYAYESEIHYPIPYVSHPAYPCCLLKSSSSDIARFLMAYINGGEINGVRILRSSTINLMNTVHYPQIAPDIGLIWLLAFRDGSKVWWHRGGNHGISTWVSYTPDEKLGIIILSNMTQWLINLDIIYDALYQYGKSKTTEVEHANMLIPKSFFLNQNYPNPFNPVTKIEYGLSKSSHVRIVIYNLQGQQVKILVNTHKPSGRFNVIWDCTDNHNFPVAAGIYFCQIETKNFRKTIKLVLSK